MELLTTACVALLIYLLIAKILSIIGSDSRTEKLTTTPVLVEDVKFDRSLKVEGTKRTKKKKVRFASDALVVCKVEKFTGQSSSDPVDDDFEGSFDGGCVIVPDEKSEVSVESPELGFVVEETRVNDCEKGMKLGCDYDDDDRSGDVRVMEVGNELDRNEDVEGETVVKLDDQSEHIGVVEAKEDQVCEMKEIVDPEMVKTVDDRSEHLVVMELGADRGKEITRDCNGNENVDTEVRVFTLEVDQGSEIAKELTEGENADKGLGNKLVNDNVSELDEKVGLVNSHKDNGSETETELDKNENDNGQIGMALASDVILDDKSRHEKKMEIGESDEDEKCGIHSELNEGEEGLIYDEDDDWEGIEKSELEKVFATAANYVNDDQLLSLGSDVQMELYGLHKVAMEGPCHEAQPMALKVSARAKWNAWQKLGNMSPDVAMEQYIDLLSDKFPGWSKQDNKSTKGGEVDLTGAAMPGVLDPHTTNLVDSSQKEKKMEITSCSDGSVQAGCSNSMNEDEE